MTFWLKTLYYTILKTDEKIQNIFFINDMAFDKDTFWNGTNLRNDDIVRGVQEYINIKK